MMKMVNPIDNNSVPSNQPKPMGNGLKCLAFIGAALVFGLIAGASGGLLFWLSIGLAAVAIGMAAHHMSKVLAGMSKGWKKSLMHGAAVIGVAVLFAFTLGFLPAILSGAIFAFVLHIGMKKESDGGQEESQELQPV